MSVIVVLPKTAWASDLERSLILDEVSRQEKIGVDNESLDQEFNSTLVDLQAQGLNLSNVRGGKQGQQRVAEAVAMESASRLLTRRTLERLKGIATGMYTPGAESTETLVDPGASEAVASAEPSAENPGAAISESPDLGGESESKDE